MIVRKEEYSAELQPFFAKSDMPYRQDFCEFVVVRSDKGEVLAAGMTWKNPIHPLRRYLYVSVTEAYRRHGLGRAVYAALQMLHPGEKWQAMIDSENTAAARWLSDMGFVCAKKCYVEEVSCMDMKQQADEEMELTAFKDLTERQAVYLAAMIRADYARKHERINPLSEEYDDELFMPCIIGNLDSKNSVCLIENDKIEAYVCCYESDEAYTLDIGHTGHRMDSSEKYRRFLVCFLNRAFEAAGGLVIEADDCDEDMMQLLSLFDVLPEYSCDTYITP